MDVGDHQYYSIQYLRDQARSEWIPLRDELRPMISVRDAFQLKLNEVILEWELTQETLAKLLKTIKYLRSYNRKRRHRIPQGARPKPV